MASSRQSEKRKRVKIWGTDKKELETVTITCIEYSRMQRDFSSVKFNDRYQLREGKLCEATIESYQACKLNEAPNTDSTETTLTHFVEELQPLGNLVHALPGDDVSWDVYDDDDILDYGLPFLVRKAFLYNMDRTNGKEAMRSLLNKMLTILNLPQKLFVTQTGTTSHMTYCATAIALQMVYKSSSASDSSEESDRKRKQPKRELFPSSAAKASQVDLDSDEKMKMKLCTSDILVYSMPSKMDKPIETRLVVSISKGCIDKKDGLVQELLSRLPYQTSLIYGLHINALEASLCSVNYVSKQNTVNVCYYNRYLFRKINQPFCVSSFSDMIFDIAKILSGATNSDID